MDYRAISLADLIMHLRNQGVTKERAIILAEMLKKTAEK